MSDRRRKVWVRSSSQTLTAPAGSSNLVSVQSLRQNSLVSLPITGTFTGLSEEFTVVRLIGHWYLEHFANPASAGTTNNPPCIFGVRVAGVEEIEEMAGDPNFALESGPSGDPMADWMAWVPCYADNPSGYDVNATEITAGKGMFDLRAARRVDGLREDIALLAQMQGTVPTGMISSYRISWQALCLV